MKRALFMTVGTGIGLEKEKKIRNLAHGLLTSVTHYKPDKIVFFGSEGSKETVKSLELQYQDKEGRELKNYEFVELEKIDDFYKCYTKIEEEIKRKKDYEIIIDYTSGTKTMTTSAAICAMLYKKELTLVGGKRGENGIVTKGTEAVQQQNLFAAYDKYLLDKVKEAFNSYRFGEAKDYLTGIVGLEEEKEKYENLVQAYDLWDKFEHEKALEKLKGLKIEEIDTKQFNYNKEFLSKRMREDNTKKNLFKLADLINNANRRMNEEKYDDTVARLYRAIEFMGEIRLKEEHEIDTSNLHVIDLMALPLEKKTKEKYEKYKDEEGKIRLPLSGTFELLCDLNDDLGKKYSENEQLKDLLSKRNNSILAHGNTPVDKDHAKRFFEKVEEYKESFPELGDWIRKSKFASLNENLKY